MILHVCQIHTEHFFKCWSLTAGGVLTVCVHHSNVSIQKISSKHTNSHPENNHFNLPTQLSHRLQWEARGGLKILQVKQYFSLTVWPLMTTSLVLGGGL